jgi:hypothetical protein
VRAAPRHTFSTQSTQMLGTLSLSKLSSDLRKASTLPMYFLPAAQLTSLGTLPPGAVSTMHEDTTWATQFGGGRSWLLGCQAEERPFKC